MLAGTHKQGDLTVSRKMKAHMYVVARKLEAISASMHPESKLQRELASAAADIREWVIAVGRLEDEVMELHAENNELLCSD